MPSYTCHRLTDLYFLAVWLFMSIPKTTKHTYSDLFISTHKSSIKPVTFMQYFTFNTLYTFVPDFFGINMFIA